MILGGRIEECSSRACMTTNVGLVLRLPISYPRNSTPCLVHRTINTAPRSSPSFSSCHISLHRRMGHVQFLRHNLLAMIANSMMRMKARFHCLGITRSPLAEQMYSQISATSKVKAQVQETVQSFEARETCPPYNTDAT